MARDEGYLTPEEIGALREVARERLERDRKERSANTPFERTYDSEVENLRGQGIEVQDARHCWLRLRRHSYLGWFETGSPAYGAFWKLCVTCGHRKKTMVCGGAITYLG